MVTFFITSEERRRAQQRAAALDIDKSEPPGRFPYVWDNRLNSVKRWYNYEAATDKVGTVYFRSVLNEQGNLSGSVECTTEITRHPTRPGRPLQAEVITEPKPHQELVRMFLRELLDLSPTPTLCL